MSQLVRCVLVVLVLLGVAPVSSAAPEAPARPLVVASKKFPESVLLSEILAQALEREGVRVERRVNLGNTALAFEALRQGSIDVYPEYSGTALGLLGLDRSRVKRGDVTLLVRRELERRFGLSWGPPLGFDNSYALAVRRDFARRHQLSSLGDLAKLSHSEPLRAAFSHEFLAREDGYRPLAARYGLRLSERATEHGVAYQLLAAGQVDTLDVYTTEGLIAAHELVVLEDDAGFFPPYEAAYLYGPRFARDARALGAVSELSGIFDNARMRRLNRQVEVDGKPTPHVAAVFLRDLAGVAANSERRQELGFWELLVHDRDQLLGHLRRHLELTLLAMLLCVLVGVPLGYLASRSTAGATLGLGVSGALQTVPSLALLVLAIPLSAALLAPLGQESLVLEAAALLTLFLYSLLPVVRNTKQGLEGIDAAVLEAARGTGMTRRQLLYWVELPLALPVILAGVRTAFVITVGTATLAAFVGAGGLGVPIISGLSVQNYTQVWTGAVPAALLALLSDAMFWALQQRVDRAVGAGS